VTTQEAAPPEAPGRLLERIRKLLAKAGNEGVSPPEAEALTAKAAELMAKYGIDRALLAADQPETDRPADRIVTVENPWSRVKAHLLTGLATALRCQCVLLTGRDGLRVHIFGYGSDLERADILYTSLLVQMWHGLVAAQVPDWASSPRAWRRSWLLGFASAVTARVRAAEEAAAGRASRDGQDGGGGGARGSRTALVLADRSDVIGGHVGQAYPRLRRTRITYSGSGYGVGYTQGQRADIGTARVARPRGRALSGRTG
jgi:hypothetical protein